MTDQTQRLEIATVKAEVGSNILYRFSNDGITSDPIPTNSGDIKNLKQEAAAIRSAANAAVAQAVADGIVDLEGSVVEAQELAEAAQLSAGRAEGAADAAVATGKVYQDTAAGLAATAINGYFSVPSADSNEYLILYQNRASVAVEVKRYPSTKAVKRLDLALDPQVIPNVVWSVGDAFRGHPVRLMDDGTLDLDGVRSDALYLRGAEYLRSKGIPGVHMAIMDSMDNACWLIRSSGVNKVASLEADTLSIAGVDILERVRLTGVAKNNDMVMGPNGLVPQYPNMKAITSWGSSSLEYIGALFAGMFTELAAGTTYHNGAQGGETSRHIAGRLGSIPLLITVPGGSIPASGAVDVTCLNAAVNVSLKPFTGWLNGVYGTLTCSTTTFSFARSVAGVVTAVSANTPFIPELGPLHRKDVALLWMGKNDMNSTDTVAEIAARTDTSFDYFRPATKRIMVFGHFANTDWRGAIVEKCKAVSDLHAARYDINYFDTMAYLSSPEVWTETGINPTAADLVAQAEYRLPASLTNDYAHFNAALNRAFTARVKARLQTLGWY